MEAEEVSASLADPVMAAEDVPAAPIPDDDVARAEVIAGAPAPPVIEAVWFPDMVAAGT